MGTRSTIAIQNANGTVTGIYCHWDGYTAHNGRILQDCYTTEASVRELISFGDMSSLGESIHPDPEMEHTFNRSQNGVCVYYGRDRGEKNVEAKTCANWTALLEDFGQEYDYLFVPGQGWEVRCYNGAGALAEALERDAVADEI